MRNHWSILCVVVGMCVLAGCATPLNSLQRRELGAYQAKGLLVAEKSPGVGAVLGILPGGGSFYTRHYGCGIVNLLLWPLSVCWDPVSGYRGAQSINYYATKAALSAKMNRELEDIEDDLEAETISKETYLMKKKRIKRRYSPDI